jgi:membrane protein required for colicin V production
MEVNLLDIIILIPLLLFAFNGYKKGLIIEIATLIALVLGIYAAIHFSDYTAGLLTESFSIDKEYLSILSFIVTFIVVLVLVLMLGKVLEKLVNILMLGILNKLAGAVFGILKGALLMSVLIFLINYMDSNSTIIKKEAIKKSFLYNKVEPIAPWIYKKLDIEEVKKAVPDPKKLI